jgi:YfiH family protein
VSSARPEEVGGYRLRLAANGVATLHSPLLAALEEVGILHGFATRLGGVSEGSFASLNFGIRGGDHPEHVAENLSRLATALALRGDRCFRVRQVHGRVLQEVASSDLPEAIARGEADALLTRAPGNAVGVLTADCVPVLFVDPARRIVAAAHAGWRGIVGGVLEAAVASLRGHGSTAGELLAASGPCIGPCCYEVGPEVAEPFAARFPEAVQPARGRGRPHLDLQVAVGAALRGLGLDPARIDRPTICTRCRADLCYSYRRDGDRTGHHLSVIGIG